MKRVVIGIDTSAYTTSLCAIDCDSKKILFEKRKILDVPLGEKGLRQNMAVFQHMKNLPCFIEELFSAIPSSLISCIAVSSRPNPITGSYMPVFFAGHTYARVLSSSLSIPLYTFSHQEGHIAAGVGTLEHPIDSKGFIAIHISGGTSEICLVETTDEGYEIQLLGGTTDLHAGQFIDRVGVKMGFSFPAGNYLEKKATESKQKVVIPSSVRGFEFSFSGPATKAERLLEQGCAEADVARGVEHCIAKTIDKILHNTMKSYSLRDVLIVGGVASNTYIREYLRQQFSKSMKLHIHFADRKFSSDNAYGTSLLGMNKYGMTSSSKNILF